MSVSWFSMDFFWMNELLFMSKIFGILTICLCVLAVSIKAFKIFANSSYIQLSQVAYFFTELAIACWVSMNFLWMIEQPGKNIAFSVGIIFLIIGAILDNRSLSTFKRFSIWK